MAEIQPGYSGVYVPSTNVWDVSNVENANIDDPALKELLIRLYQNLNDLSLAVNLKSSGYFVTQQFVNSELFFPNPSLTSASSTTPDFRQVIRKVINFGALPDNALKQVAHGITTTAATTFTRIYGCASYPAASSNIYLPLPFSSATNNIAPDPIEQNSNIELFADGTYVYVRTLVNYSVLTTTYVILEYISS